ncbi:MAG: hypothetical protein JJ913_06990 [Rhizobiaceae bacterium]|nr:hypothetical protein [Rhizobiaceae bacterium]
MHRALLIAPLLLLVAASSSVAQDSGRYRLERTESGFVRMDTTTGRMSFCESGSAGLSCADADDQAASDQDRIDALTRQVAALEARVAALEAGNPGEPSAALPSDEEFEQTMSLMERFLRRFMGIVKDIEGDATEEPAPDRT